MTPRIALLHRALLALQNTQRVHELSYRIGVAGSDAAGFADGESMRECQVLLEEAAGLCIDIEREIALTNHLREPNAP